MQLVFVHGPGASGSTDAWVHQRKHFAGSLAPDLPGGVAGKHCPDVPRYMEWLRGWLWAQGKTKDLVLVGYTLGSSIALQYALDYPEEVAGLVLCAVEIEPRPVMPVHLERCRVAATGDPKIYEEWVQAQRRNLMLVEPELRERLVDKHRVVGPKSQYESLLVLLNYDIRARVPELKTPLLLIRGADDPTNAPESEEEIHRMLPHSKLVRLPKAGHFPPTERPVEVNRLIEEFVGSL